MDDIEEKRESLEDRVHAAMKKLGLSFDGNGNISDTSVGTDTSVGAAECKDGNSNLPTSSSPDKSDKSSWTNLGEDGKPKEDIRTIAKRIADEMKVDESIVLAAIGATLNSDGEVAKSGENGAQDGEDDSLLRVNENAAKDMIQYEVDAINRVMGDCEEVSENMKF